MPSISRKLRKKIIDQLNIYKLTVKTLPSVQDVIDGNVSISDIRDLDIADLLNQMKFSQIMNY